MRAVVALGGNVGTEAQIVARFQQVIGGLQAFGVVTAVSRVYRSLPVGEVLDQPSFLNAALLLDTTSEPAELLRRFQEMERAAGRERGTGEKDGPRTLDLDLIEWGDACVEVPGLSVPHPRATSRAFVLRPLADILGLAHRIPGQQETVEQLLARAPAAEQEIAPLDRELFASE